MKHHKKYTIIICDKCKNPKITETIHKTTGCPRCGKTIRLDKTVFLFETNNISEARQIIGQINAKKDEKLEEFKKFLKKQANIY